MVGASRKSGRRSRLHRMGLEFVLAWLTLVGAHPLGAQEAGGLAAYGSTPSIAAADTEVSAGSAGVSMVRWGDGLSAQVGLGDPRRSAGPDEVAAPTASQEDVRPFTLEGAVAVALRNNRQLAMSQYDLKVANKQVSEAYGALFPEVDGFASLQRNLQVPSAFLPKIFIDPDADPDELIAVTFGADNQWTAGLTVNQPLFDAGVFVGVGTAGAFRNLAREALRGSAQGIATSTRIAYLNVLLAQEAVRVTQNSIERVRQTLDETRALYRAGLASDYDVLRLEVQLANIEPNLRRAQNEVDETRRVLAIEMGLGEGGGAAAFGELHRIDLAQGAENTEDNFALLTFTGVPEASVVESGQLELVALENRTDLRQARLQRDLEQARVSYERTQLFPQLSAFFNWGIQAQESGALNFFGENPNQRFTTAAVGVQLDVPLFQGGRRWNRVEQRKIGVRQAEERIGDLRQRAVNEVETLRAQLTEARSRAEAQRRAVGEAERGFEIVRTEYLAGTQPRLEVTEAELALRQAEQNYAVAVYDYLVAQAQLDLAVGVVPVVDPLVARMIDGDLTPEDRALPGETGSAALETDRQGER